MTEEERNNTPEETPAPDVADAPADSPTASPEEASAVSASSDEAGAEPAAPTDPKERRKQARSRHTEARPARTAEDRAAERAERRSARAAARRAWRGKQREKRTTPPGATQLTPPAPEHGPGRPRVRQGVVVSDKANKTITVRIDTARQHRTYKKIVRASSTLHAHDESNEANAGDTVRVVESRPLSRTKRWRLVEVVERAR